MLLRPASLGSRGARQTAVTRLLRGTHDELLLLLGEQQLHGGKSQTPPAARSPCA